GHSVKGPSRGRGATGETRRKRPFRFSTATAPIPRTKRKRVARPEIAMVDEVVLVGADPQLLIANARLEIVERRQHAGLKHVEPGCDVEAGDLDRAAEIVRRSKRVRCRVRDDFVEKRL